MNPILDPVIQLHPQDNIAIALMDLYPEMSVSLNGNSIPIQARIPLGHKIALTEISTGDAVLRYGWRIGSAKVDIHPGDWVHSHNLGIGDMERDFDIPQMDGLEEAHQQTSARTFQGFLRADGRVGTRNSIAIISAINCINPVVRCIQQYFTAEKLSTYPNVDAVIAVTIDTGCSMAEDGFDHHNLRRTIRNLAKHPNFAACLVVGLGCEVNQMAEVLEPIGVPLLVVQEAGGSKPAIQQGIDWVKSQLDAANKCQRTPQPLSKLTLALQCGGSDAFSGITGNPLLGEIADRVVLQGGTAVIAETTEIFGAEQLLLQRCATSETREKLQSILRWWQDYTARLGISVDNNPSPGNKKGGLTTIFEKSLGAISKCGHLPLENVLMYGESAAGGVCFMDSPGNDVSSLTGQLASGCNLALFTTGRGSTFATGISPCLKVATNTTLYERMLGDMDFNAGKILEGTSMDSAADELLELIIETASGAWTKSDPYVQEIAELVPWRSGATL